MILEKSRGRVGSKILFSTYFHLKKLNKIKKLLKLFKLPNNPKSLKNKNQMNPKNPNQTQFAIPTIFKWKKHFL